jgi:hypothetical protein
MLILSTALGCATTLSTRARQVRDADPAMVQQCTFLGDLTGSSNWGGFAKGTGMENAKNEVREKAADLGATHVVFTHTQEGSTSGRAYRCDAAPAHGAT